MESPLLLMMYAGLAGLCWALLALSYKIAESSRCRPTAFGLVFTLVAGVFTLLKSCAEPSTWQDPRLWYLGLTMGVMLFLGIQIAMRAYTLGSAAITWTVVNLSLLVPIFLAHLVYHEALYWIDLGILTLFLLMLITLTRGAGEGEGEGTHAATRVAPFLLALLSIFFVNGSFMFGMKVKDVLFVKSNSAALCAIVYFTCTLIAVCVLRLREGNIRVLPVEWRAGTLAGMTSGLGFLLFLAAVRLPAIVVFPLGQGVSLLGGVGVTALVYKERFNKFKALGLALGITVFMLAGFREQLAAWLTPHLPTTITAQQEHR